ncbi:hypothetical protein D3C72_1271010 [compost metagenome]
MQALHRDGEVGPDQGQADQAADNRNPAGDDADAEQDQPTDPEMLAAQTAVEGEQGALEVIAAAGVAGGEGRAGGGAEGGGGIAGQDHDLSRFEALGDEVDAGPGADDAAGLNRRTGEAVTDAVVAADQAGARDVVIAENFTAHAQVS